MPAVVGIDIGGTFTDVVHVDLESGALAVDKVPSVPERLHDGAEAGMAALAARHGVELGAVEVVVHGTTVATNALIEQRLPRTALVTTAGFGDILEIGTMLRPKAYDLLAPKARRLVPRELVCEVRERLDADGAVVEPLSEQEVDRVVAWIGRAQPQAVAICLLFAYRDGAHERRLAEAIRAAHPQVRVSLSSEVDPEIREYARANTTALNASLNPLVSTYVERFERMLETLPGARRLYVMQSNGGLIAPAAVPRNAHRMVLSGPAGGIVAAQRLLGARDADLITFDMGGTSSDLCLVAGGRAAIASSTSGHDRMPIRAASLAINAVGAGGGSIAAVDPEGVLQVGPRSAGASPGPVCYGRGGEEPTVTDAQLVLGRIAPDGLLGGEMALDREAASAAIERHVAAPLGLPLEAAAEAIVEVSVAVMERGLRVVSVNAGHDPAAFALVAFGGGGPLHACDLARAAGMRRAIVPIAPSTFSALGLVCAELSETWPAVVEQRATELDDAQLAQRFAALEQEALRAYAEQHGQDRAPSFARLVELRYVGQRDALTVASDGSGVAELVERFRAEHERAYGHASPDDPVEVVTLRLVATSPWHERGVEPARLRRRDAAEPVVAAGGARPVHFAREGWVDCAVLARGALAVGEVVEGPAVVEERETTTVLPPGARARVDAAGSLAIEVGR